MADNVHVAALRMMQRLRDAKVGDLWIGEDLVHFVDRPSRDALLLEQFEPVC